MINRSRDDQAVRKGLTWEKTFAFRDSAGTWVDLSALTVTCTIFKGETSHLVLTNASGVTFSAEDIEIEGVTYQDVPLARIVATDAQTGALAAGQYEYAITVGDAGETREHFFGTFRVLPEIPSA